MQILVWNVNKLNRHTTNPDFRLFCKSYEIIFLVETWPRSQEEYSNLFEDYQAFSCIRTKEENFSGGILMYVKKKILVGCKRILSHFKDSVFVKLDKDSFHFERDLIIGALYLSPERSTIYKEGKTGIDLLEEKIAQVLDEYDDTDLILGGDFNSRTSDMDDYIILDNPDFIPELSVNTNYESDSFSIPRNSKDKELNNYGRELVSFSRSYGMHMLNGRRGGPRG